MGLINKKESEQKPKKKFTIWSFLQTIAILGLFVDVAILVLGIRGAFHFNSNFVLILLIILIVSFSLLMSMPWIKRLEKKNDKIVSIVFLSVLIVFAILWIAATIVAVNLVKKVGEGLDAGKLANSLNFIKFTLIATMQFAIANLITTTILKYRKKLIVLQAIMYASNIYVDVWFTILFLCLKISKNGFSFNLNPFLFNGVVITILLIAICYTLILNSIVRKTQRRKYGYSMFDLDGNDEESENLKQKQNSKIEPTTEEKLVELKKMLDQNLITQEEYNKKKEDILNKM